MIRFRLLAAGFACATLFEASAEAQRKKPAPAPAATTASAAGATKEAPADEIYRLGREALGRGSFETALRLFRALSGEARWETDPRFVFNRAQAARYVGEAGEALHGYTRYLELDSKAADAATVREELARLLKTAPEPIRKYFATALRDDWEKALRDTELERALREAPAVKIKVAFRRDGAPPGEPLTVYLFAGRAVFFTAKNDETENAVWETWIVPTLPVLAPEGMGAPPLLALPAGRPFVVELGVNLVSKPVVLRAPPVPGFPVDPETEAWKLEIVVELDRLGPPVFVALGRAGVSLADVRSAPTEPFLTIGKKKRDVPSVATPISFGPRPVKADSKLWSKVPLLVVDLPGKDAEVERWAGPLGAFDVVNRFGRVDGSRLYVRSTPDGPSLQALPR
ncbi:MAG: hypothetical protein JNK60_04260 [Acidobacteria bacterium]|nr:hypothetical protein [Acidobacteriota bacterium]